jgi:GDP-4-dehydro-6-deoxy-D-mannose reductase
MPRALVTGIGGFVGPYLANHLQSLGYDVTGTSFPNGSNRSLGCPAVPLDIRKPQAVKKVVGDLRPDTIYHLAGITRPGLDQVPSFYEVNLMGTLHVLEAAREVGAEVLVVSSAYVYGKHNEPLSEEALLMPVNHYGSSKAAADLAAIGYALDGLPVVRARPFNHSGPGQSPDFLLPTLVHQLVRIEAGHEPPVLELGNLDSVRDFSDVRDVVRAYGLLMQSGESGEAYNVASGIGMSVRHLVELLVELAGVSVEIIVEPTRVRPSDIAYLVGDASKLCQSVGWQPAYDLEQTLTDMLEYERKLLQA